jgi:GT2 family glycosyltransferase
LCGKHDNEYCQRYHTQKGGTLVGSSIGQPGYGFDHTMQQRATAPDLSISIVSYNTRELLCRCLDSVFENTAGIAFEVFVVDNASRDASPEMVRTHFPQVTLMRNQINVGFAVANNQALDLAKGRIFLLLNSDTEVRENALGKLVRFMDGKPECGICCPQLYYPDGRLQVSYKGFHSPKNRALWEVTARLRKLKAIAKRRGNAVTIAETTVPLPITPTPVERPGGACFMIRIACIEDIGPMDQRFFMYCEEVDWALRAKKAGWQRYIVPQAKVIHVRGSSTSSRALLMDDIHAQSDYYYYSKHHGLSRGLLVRLGDMVGAVLALVLAIYAVVLGGRNPASLTAREEFAAFRNLSRRAGLVKPIRPQD